MKVIAIATRALRNAERRLKLNVVQFLCRAFLTGALLSCVATSATLLAQRAPVNLGSAGNYVALSQTGITDVSPSVITGNIGASPITGAAIHVTCAEVTGSISAADATGPAPCSLATPLVLTQAILDMQAGYANAAARTLPDFTELGAGNISGKSLTPGIYKWSTSVLMDNTGVALVGSPNDVWIFQIAGDLTVANGAQVTLKGGAQANNIFWQVGGPTGAILGTTSVFYGNILSAKQVILNTGATLLGRAFAQTQVTLQSNTITSPAALLNGMPVIIPGCSYGLTPTIVSGGVVNMATSAPTVAPGSIASIFGNNFGVALTDITEPLSPSIGWTSFKAGTLYAPAFMVSCGQANVQIPWESVGLSQVAVTANVGGLNSAVQTVAVAPFAPGIFTLNQTGTGQGLVEIGSTALLASPLGTFGRPVMRGEYIAIYGTGLGPVGNQPLTGAAALANPLSLTLSLPTVTIGGVTAQVTYSGLAPGLVGLYQVNAIVPAGAPSGASVNLTLSIGNTQSNTVSITIQ